ncbi:MAG TPA: hypothetical protein P5195_04425 [Anaerolineae bacterium]|nr:hypothetical protein [Anaerolineae bacterium]HRU94462.1 hypothetical protein [Anaerolineae bacterium]
MLARAEQAQKWRPRGQTEVCVTFATQVIFFADSLTADSLISIFEGGASRDKVKSKAQFQHPDQIIT